MITFSNRPKSTSTGGDVNVDEVIKEFNDRASKAKASLQLSYGVAVNTTGAVYVPTPAGSRMSTALVRLDKDSVNTYSIGAPYKVRAIYYNRASMAADSFVKMDDWVDESSGTAIVDNSAADYVLFVLANSTNTSAVLDESDVRSKFEYNITTVKGKAMEGLYVGILGDSISSRADTDAAEYEITSEDVGKTLTPYITYYDVEAGLKIGNTTYNSSHIGTNVSAVPVAADVGKKIGTSKHYDNKCKLWWEIAAEELGFTAKSASWSGASITTHQNDNTKKCSSAQHIATAHRLAERKPGTNTFIHPDVIIIYRGANDYSHEPYAELTDGYFDSFSAYPASDVISEGHYGFKEGYVRTIQRLRTAYPTTAIVLCTLPVNKRLDSDGTFPADNSTNTIQEFNKAIREVADYMGCGLIEFDKAGITYENIYTAGLATDSSTNPTHPSGFGQTVLGRKAIMDLSKQFG